MIESNTPDVTATVKPGAMHRARRVLRRLAPDRSERWALLLIAAGVLIRLGLILLDWPRTDSDEGTMGLMALHIATRGEHPLFFYGQTYMGTLQAYVGAVLFSVFGASVFTLRLGLVLLFALFLATMYVLVRLLYDRVYALFALVLLGLGVPELLKPQLLALGGYPETLLFGALSLLLATWLALGARQRHEAQGQSRWLRLTAYAGFGATLGLGWWSDPLVLPFLIAATLMLVVFCWRDLPWAGLAAVAFGLVIGLLPQIAYTIQHTAAAGPTAVAAFQPQGVGTLAQLPSRLGAQLLGTLLVSLPDISGPGWVCTAAIGHNGLPTNWPDTGALACAGLRLGWSLGLLALGVVAAVAAFGAWRVIHTSRREDYRAMVLRFGQLMLLLGGALTLAMYVVSPAAIPPGHTRYLIGVIVALPAVVYPLWSAALGQHLWSRRSVVYWSCLALIVLTLAGGVVSTYTQAPAAHAQYASDQRLIHDLERLSILHMYTDYWTCYKVAFLTNEQITCAALSNTLGPGNNRYPPYVAAVQADPHAAYVFPADSPQAAAFARKAETQSLHFTRISLDGYVVYLPR